MDQTSNGGFKKNESALQAFYHSCLGKLAILGGILILLFIVALMTKPTQEEMEMEKMHTFIRATLLSHRTPLPSKMARRLYLTV